jgi:putative Mg2+ transporter-C (MgtC) family protein
MHLGPDEILLLKVILAGSLGVVIGIERQIRRRPAGMRTAMFICMGSCLFTILSGAISARWGDPSSTRIASNLVQGIGFLGAGAILRERGTVVGLTTASVIFVLAAVGMGVGAGFYSLSTLTVLLMLVALITLGWLEDFFGLKTRNMLFRVTSPDLEPVLARIHERLDALKVQMQRFQVFHIGSNFVLEFEAEVSQSQQRGLLSSFSGGEDRCEVVHQDPEGAS